VAKIDDLTFGSVLVEGKKHHRDILIFADGIVNKRKSGLDAVARPDEPANPCALFKFALPQDDECNGEYPENRKNRQHNNDTIQQWI